MANSTALFQRCREVFDMMPHRKVGTHGRQKRTRTIKEGDIIGAFLPQQATPVMELNTDDANPARRYFSLNMPDKSAQVNVFAVPSAWPHGKSIDGASQTEVLAFLVRVQRRLAKARETSRREARQFDER